MKQNIKSIMKNLQQEPKTQDSIYFKIDTKLKQAFKTKLEADKIKMGDFLNAMIKYYCDKEKL